MINALVGNKLKFDIEFVEDGVTVDGKLLDIDLKNLGNNQYHILYDHKSYTVEVIHFDPKAKIVKLKINGKSTMVTLREDLDLLIAKLGMDNLDKSKLPDLKAPMPGLITEILVQEGDSVKTGDPLLILQAMKMENVIKCSGNGVIQKLFTSIGQRVEKNQLLIQF